MLNRALQLDHIVSAKRYVTPVYVELTLATMDKKASRVITWYEIADNPNAENDAITACLQELGILG